MTVICKNNVSIVSTFNIMYVFQEVGMPVNEFATEAWT